MDWAELKLQAITLQFLNFLRWFFFDAFLHEEDLIFLRSQFSEAHGENWSPFFCSQKTFNLDLTKLDTELGLAQPQLVLN